MKVFELPPGVEVVIGYDDGVRIYRRGDTIRKEAGMKLLEIREVAGARPRVNQVSAPLANPAVAGATAFFYLGLGLLIFGRFGPAGLAVCGLLLLWFRMLFTKAKAVNAP